MTPSSAPSTRSISATLPGGSAALLVALLLGSGAASAQERAAPSDLSASSEDSRGQVQAALERGGVPGFAALTRIAGQLETRIQADTRARVENGAEALASVADVALRVELGEELEEATPSVRLESVRLEMGRTVELRPADLRSLERGESVTAYAGALPAAIGVVRVKAEGASGESSRRLDRAFRLAVAPGQRAVIRIELVEDPRNGWDVSPVLESTSADRNEDESEERSP